MKPLRSHYALCPGPSKCCPECVICAEIVISSLLSNSWSVRFFLADIKTRTHYNLRAILAELSHIEYPC
jgi:hypothetical protein